MYMTGDSTLPPQPKKKEKYRNRVAIQGIWGKHKIETLQSIFSPLQIKRYHLELSSALWRCTSEHGPLPPPPRSRRVTNQRQPTHCSIQIPQLPFPSGNMGVILWLFDSANNAKYNRVVYSVCGVRNALQSATENLKIEGEGNDEFERAYPLHPVHATHKTSHTRIRSTSVKV